MNIKYNKIFIKKFNFSTLCPNNHYEIINFKEYTIFNRFSFNSNKCKIFKNNMIAKNDF